MADILVQFNVADTDATSHNNLGPQHLGYSKQSRGFWFKDIDGTEGGDPIFFPSTIGQGMGRRYSQPSHGFVLGTAVRYTSESGWVRALGNQIETFATHLVVRRLDADRFEVAQFGSWDLGAAVAGTYWLSASSAGELTATQPGEIAQKISICDGTTHHLVLLSSLSTSAPASNIVTTDTEQTIGAKKTFTDVVTFELPPVTSGLRRSAVANAEGGNVVLGDHVTDGESFSILRHDHNPALAWGRNSLGNIEVRLNGLPLAWNGGPLVAPAVHGHEWDELSQIPLRLVDLAETVSPYVSAVPVLENDRFVMREVSVLAQDILNKATPMGWRDQLDIDDTDDVVFGSVTSRDGFADRETHYSPLGPYISVPGAPDRFSTLALNGLRVSGVALGSGVVHSFGIQQLNPLDGNFSDETRVIVSALSPTHPQIRFEITGRLQVSDLPDFSVEGSTPSEMRIVVQDALADSPSTGNALPLLRATPAEIVAAGGGIQALDPMLVAIAGLTSASEQMLAFDGLDTPVTIPLTTYARSLLAGATASAVRGTLEVVELGETSATAYRGDRGKIAYDHSQVSTGNPHNTAFADLASVPAPISALSPLVPVADRFAYYTGAGTAALATIRSFGRSFIGSADAAAALTTLGAQAADPTLTALANLAGTADSIPYFNGVDTMAKTGFSAFARTLLDDSDAVAARTTLGVEASGDWRLIVSAGETNNPRWHRIGELRVTAQFGGSTLVFTHATRGNNTDNAAYREYATTLASLKHNLAMSSPIAAGGLRLTTTWLDRGNSDRHSIEAYIEQDDATAKVVGIYVRQTRASEGITASLLNRSGTTAWSVGSVLTTTPAGTVRTSNLGYLSAESAQFSSMAGTGERVAIFNASGEFATPATITAFAKTFLDDADAATVRATLGITAGTDELIKVDAADTTAGYLATKLTSSGPNIALVQNPASGNKSLQIQLRSPFAQTFPFALANENYSTGVDGSFTLATIFTPDEDLSINGMRCFCTQVAGGNIKFVIFGANAAKTGPGAAIWQSISFAVPGSIGYASWQGGSAVTLTRGEPYWFAVTGGATSPTNGTGFAAKILDNNGIQMNANFPGKFFDGNTDITSDLSSSGTYLTARIWLQGLSPAL